MENEINFEQELYKAFGQVKDFTLGMRIAKWFYNMGKNSKDSQEPVSENLEEASLLYYPKMSRITEHHGVIPADYESHYLGDANEEKREGYVKGYLQAEKDLELTWEDIADILDVTDVIANDDSMEERLKTMSEEEYYQEVLKRFKKLKVEQV